MFGVKLGLENIARLTSELGIRFEAFPYLFHVAGTNGKGSVCATIEQVCRDAGLRTGLYTSPHLITCRERVRIGGAPVSCEMFADGIERIREAAAQWDHAPTFFEIMTALALWSFQREQCEAVVLETGMGGRFDATNVVTPTVSVLTPISMDHEQWLGSTIEAIAGEKAGIIKPGVPVVSAGQLEAARCVLVRRAAEIGAPVTFVSEPWSKSPVALAGEHQQRNAAVAVEAIRAANISVAPDVLNAALTSVCWPARFQRIGEGIVVDGAHNPAGAAVLKKTWQQYYPGEEPVAIIAMLAGKDISGICREFAGITKRFVVTKVKNSRSAEPAVLAEAIRRHAPGAECVEASDTPSALKLASESGRKILIAGSLYLAGEALAILDPGMEPDPPCSF